MEGVRILSAPEHTRGGQSILVETQKGKVIIRGLCTIKEYFEAPEPIRKFIPVIPPGIHLDIRQAFDSLIRIKEQADIIVPLHEAEFALQGTIPQREKT